MGNTGWISFEERYAEVWPPLPTTQERDALLCSCEDHKRFPFGHPGRRRMQMNSIDRIDVLQRGIEDFEWRRRFYLGYEFLTSEFQDGVPLGKK